MVIWWISLFTLSAQDKGWCWEGGLLLWNPDSYLKIHLFLTWGKHRYPILTLSLVSGPDSPLTLILILCPDGWGLFPFRRKPLREPHSLGQIPFMWLISREILDKLLTFSKFSPWSIKLLLWSFVKFIDLFIYSFIHSFIHLFILQLHFIET